MAEFSGEDRAVVREFLRVVFDRMNAGTFDADKVGMSNRRLAEGNCELTPVPLVRFRKSLATHYPASGTRHGGGHHGAGYHTGTRR